MRASPLLLNRNVLVLALQIITNSRRTRSKGVVQQASKLLALDPLRQVTISVSSSIRDVLALVTLVYNWRTLTANLL